MFEINLIFKVYKRHSGRVGRAGKGLYCFQKLSFAWNSGVAIINDTINMWFL